MRRNFHEDFAREEVPPPSARSTGFVFAGVAAIVGAFFWDNLAVLGACLGVSAVLALVSWLRPGLLEPVNMLWFRFSMLLYRVVNPVVMLLMYVVAIVPTGLVMQMLRDPLHAKRARGGSSYWVERGAQATPESSMENQF
ncbi:MAG: hypothetical protein ACR2PO_20060 [Methyloligellaceae bacterium]